MPRLLFPVFLLCSALALTVAPGCSSGSDGGSDAGDGDGDTINLGDGDGDGDGGPGDGDGDGDGDPGDGDGDGDGDPGDGDGDGDGDPGDGDGDGDGDPGDGDGDGDATCSGQCASFSYSTCTCGDDDPCGWSADGICDDDCAQIVDEPFDDASDCGLPDDGMSAFTEMIEAAEAAPENERQALVDAFVSAHGPNFPYIEDEAASILYRSSTASSVQLAGDHTAWSSAPDTMAKLAGTDLFHITYVVPWPEARIDYKVIVDGNWILDPLNPNVISGGFGENSELRMPEWSWPTELNFNGAIPHGTVNGVEVHEANSYPAQTFTSTVLANDRNVWIYRPPGYSDTVDYPSLYVNDGGEYISIARMPIILDNLIAAGQMRPIVVVFVDPVNRGPEYVGNDVPSYVDLVTTELVPWAEAQVSVIDDATWRGVMGTSNGGHISARIGYEHPELFAVIGSQSGALAAYDGSLASSYAAGTVGVDRVAMDCGIINDFLGANQSFRDALIAGGVDHIYDEYPEGHSWGNWRAHVDTFLTFLFPPL